MITGFIDALCQGRFRRRVASYRPCQGALIVYATFGCFGPNGTDATAWGSYQTDHGGEADAEEESGVAVALSLGRTTSSLDSE